MKTRPLTPAQIEKVSASVYDHMIEKHEGPWYWENEFRRPDDQAVLLDLGGWQVLLPYGRERLGKLVLLSSYLSTCEHFLTLQIRDEAFAETPEAAWLYAHLWVILEKVPREEFYLTLYLHPFYPVASGWPGAANDGALKTHASPPTMRELDQATIDRIQAASVDVMIDQIRHPGPQYWRGGVGFSVEDFFSAEVAPDPEMAHRALPAFVELVSAHVLLPIPSGHHSQLKVIKEISSVCGTLLTVFLVDETYEKSPYPHGYVAIAYRLPGQQLYVAAFYHPWIMNARGLGKF